MSLLERVIIAHKCRSMHHYIAMEALNQIGGDEAEEWKAMLLRHNASLLEGAKAPDARFKDFQNHVLHVQEGEWGGARDAAMEWYGKSVETLRNKDWRNAAYCLGVLSHYYADVCQPFHTGQTEEEGAIHRAVEWSIVKSVDAIFAQLDETGYPEIEAGEGSGFVADMVLDAAKASNPHYQTFIDHYDVDAGVSDPPTGIDETMFNAVCEMVAHATSGFATLVTCAIDEAGVAAPRTHLTLRGYLASLKIPLRWITRKLEDRGDRKTVEKMYRELQKTGKVIKTLSEDDKLIRKVHARHVLRVPLEDLDAQELEPIGSKHVPWEMPDIAYDVEEDVEDAHDREDDTEAETSSADGRVDDDTRETVPQKLTRAEKREARRAEKAARKAEKAEAGRAELELAEDDEDIDQEISEEVESFDVEEDEITLDSDPDEQVLEFEANYEDTDDFEAELAELAAIDLDMDTNAERDAALSAERDFAAEQAATEHLRTDRLGLESPVVDAPSIGRKTAKRLAKANIRTVVDLLDADPEDVADRLKVRYITPEKILDWQDQTMLMMEVPGLRTHDVQVLVGAGIRSGADLAKASAHDVFQAAIRFLATEDGERVARFENEALAEAEVEEWIDLAKQEAA